VRGGGARLGWEWAVGRRGGELWDGRLGDRDRPARHYLVDSDGGSPARPRARYHGDPHPARHL